MSKPRRTSWPWGKKWHTQMYVDVELVTTLVSQQLGELPHTPPVQAFAVRTDTAGSNVVQSGRPIFDDLFQHLWPYIGNNTANVVFQMVKRLWLIRIDQ
ncbi:hypothetical protein TNCV_3224351 [Trichonephila clavipes]|nr:hypothetical protein TNCV_3224351 [Trichonephila clavipes]